MRRWTARVFVSVVVIVVAAAPARAAEDSGSASTVEGINRSVLPYHLGVDKLDSTFGLGDFANESTTPLVAQSADTRGSAGAVGAAPEGQEESVSELNRKLTDPVSTIWSLSNQFNNFKLENGHWNNNWNFQPVLPRCSQ